MLKTSPTTHDAQPLAQPDPPQQVAHGAHLILRRGRPAAAQVSSNIGLNKVTAPISIPNEVVACVRAMGGTVLDDVLEKPDFSNADYWFPEDHVVAELKCLTEDSPTSQEFGRSISTLYSSWVRRGLIPKDASFADMIARKGKSDIGDRTNTQIIQPLIDANARLARSDLAPNEAEVQA